jgi:3-phenylpropionate/trans-cinnamate dioxygenase ferredoxin reductase subunit
LRQTFAVVGASLAGGTAAATLRAEGFDGRVVLIGAEPLAPYERPPLSKGFLSGAAPFEASLLRPATFWEEQDIECRFGVRATTVDASDRRVHLDDGDSVAYGKLLVTTGLRNRTLPVPGVGLSGIHQLRTVADAEAIRAAMAPGGSAVVVGMGFIGAEVAATLRGAGMEVTAIEPFPGPVYRALGPEVSAIVAGIHRDEGVTMHFEEGVEAFEGRDHVDAVRTTSGRHLGCDLAVVGVGTVPVTDFMEGTGVTIDNGIVVDQFCRTGVEGIYAAGDVANHYHPASGRHLRVEHWQNALKQGAAAARSMLGKEEPYDEVHWFWSDQYTHNIQCAGTMGAWEDAVVRGNLAGRRFIAFYLAEGRLEGALSINLGRDLRRAIPVIKAKAAMDPSALADPAVDVRSATLGG